MSDKITWTFVDAHVRRALDDRGTLAFGTTDAEVTMGYIAFLERSLKTKEQVCEQLSIRADSYRTEVENLRKAVRPGKTKQRLADLEENVDFIRRHLGIEL